MTELFDIELFDMTELFDIELFDMTFSTLFDIKLIAEATSSRLNEIET